MARWDLHPEVVDLIDTEPPMRQLAEDIRDDARAIVTKDTGRTAEAIHVELVTRTRAVIVSDAARAEENGEEHYDAYLELGTAEHGHAQPFLRPAAQTFRI
jgi:hypothetical protein